MSRRRSTAKRVLGVALKFPAQPTRSPVNIAPPAPHSTKPMLLIPRVPKSVITETFAALRATSPNGKEVALRQLATAHSGRDADAVSARALLLTLADLAQQGWSLGSERKGVFVAPPAATGAGGESVSSVKERQRASLLAARAAQLGDAAVRDFIRRAETSTVVKGRRISVLDLIDDGHDLAVALRDIARLPPSERHHALRGVVRPEIDVVLADTRCSETGLPLMDVWRYFRHTWSLEYRPTPGRTLLLLIRNAARPLRPIMGIASLANALPQLRVREEWIGWTPHGVLAEAQRDTDTWTEQREALLRTLRTAEKAVRADDLLKGGGGKLVGEALEQRLRELAGAAASRREEILRERQEQLDRGEEVESLKNLPLLKSGEIDWIAASERPLFRHKRAKTLADVLFAQRLLKGASKDGATFAKQCAEDVALQRALAIGLREIRKVGLASRLLELNVCGAVAPYGDLLVGKLVALSVGSAEVLAAYRDRYGAQVSEIASQMAGKAVIRSPDVCAVTTTSLYAVSASQYNRLRVNVKTNEGEVPLRWDEIGETEGFGTVHLGEDAVTALRQLSTIRRGGRWVNNVFGEGNSARLRQVREGLEELGLDTDSILRHSQFRKMYGLETVRGGLRALRLNLPTAAEAPTFGAIAEAWRMRWLTHRIESRDVISRVAQAGAQTVRASLAPPQTAQRDLFAQPEIRATNGALSGARRPFMPRQPRLELVQHLYRDAGAVADHHDAATVEALHIPTKLDDFIRERAQAGDIMFVTGNPGDGKTHLLKRLAPDIAAAKAEACLDANEVDDDHLLSMIGRALKAKRGCVIAINEGILVELLRRNRNVSWASDVEEQLLHPFSYVGPGQKSDARQNGETTRFKVIDLNQRNNLAKAIVERALAKLLSFTGPCASCPGAEKCTSQFNTARVAIPEVAQRLSHLLDAVARTGFHATMRDLHGFLAYLLVDRTTCEGLNHIASPPIPYWENAFGGGQGPLFDAVRRLDPQHHPLPLLDDLLWRSAVSDADWIIGGGGNAPEPATLLERLAIFVSQKRRALFEHRDGVRILEQTGSQAERMLIDLVNRKQGPKEVVRLLNRFFDRDDSSGGLLRLWTSHRYDARPSRYAASASEVATSQLEVRVPTLRSSVATAFEDFRPDHVMLCLRDSKPSDGLRIDISLIDALLAAEQGLPATFRRGEPEARVTAFFDRLARSIEESAGATTEVRFVDMNSGANLVLGVDIAAKRYSKSSR